MPLYDYECKDCQKLFEAMVKPSTTPTCPACGSTSLSKQISRPAEPGKSAGIIARARAQASREGHFSNYSAGERPRTK